jgi:hypothetical protein
MEEKKPQHTQKKGEEDWGGPVLLPRGRMGGRPWIVARQPGQGSRDPRILRVRTWRRNKEKREDERREERKQKR